jgi:hypothetical protein
MRPHHNYLWRQTVRMLRDVRAWRDLIGEYRRMHNQDGYTPQTRGQRFNGMIAELLRCWGLNAEANIHSTGEIDVAFVIDGAHYILEAKWEKKKTDTGRIAKLQKRVRQRIAGTRGVLLSMSG